MNLIENIFYEYQYSKYVRKMPFYMIRHFGIKDLYSPENVEDVIRKYGFNSKYRAIGYAMFCSNDAYEKALSDLKTHPTRGWLRKEILDKYFAGKRDFSLNDLMKKSKFKSDYMMDESMPNGEYWQAMLQLDEQFVNSALVPKKKSSIVKELPQEAPLQQHDVTGREKTK